MEEAHLVAFPDRPRAGNPCSLLRESHLPRLPDQKEPDIPPRSKPCLPQLCGVRRRPKNSILDFPHPRLKEYPTTEHPQGTLGHGLCSSIDCPYWNGRADLQGCYPDEEPSCLVIVVSRKKIQSHFSPVSNPPRWEVAYR